MRILFCNYEYPPLGGGGGVINALLAQEMAKRHEVTVLTSQGLGLPQESMENGVRVVRVPVLFRRQAEVANLLSMAAFIPRGIKVGKKLLQDNHYDVINTHFVLPSGPVGDILARLGGIPHVLSPLGGDLYDPSKRLSPHRHLLLRAWIRWLLRRSNMVVWASTNTLENMRRFYTPEIEGVYIPLGIQRPEQDAASRQQYGFAQDEVLLVTVGRLIPRKATSQLLTAMQALRQERVRLLIIGSGPEETLLKEESAKKHLENHICFVGHVEEAEKFRLLQMCDFYVSTSQHEGFGLVFLEAMACGLPIVCYNYGGQTDFLEHTTTGYLPALNDLESFVGYCRCLIKDRDLRLRVGQENLRRVNDLFIDRCAERYEEIFREAMACRQIQGLVSLSNTRKLPLKSLETGLTPGCHSNRTDDGRSTVSLRALKERNLVS